MGGLSNHTGQGLFRCPVLWGFSWPASLKALNLESLGMVLRIVKVNIGCGLLGRGFDDDVSGDHKENLHQTPYSMVL